MTNHPNRSKERGPGSAPTPDELEAVRVLSGLSEGEACALIYATLTQWHAWRAGERRMHPGLFELLLIKTGLLECVPSRT